MKNKDLLEKLNALLQLQDEKDSTCRIYTNCSACPNLLAGGYCEIKLAISKLNSEINKIYKEQDENDLVVKKVKIN